MRWSTQKGASAAVCGLQTGWVAVSFCFQSGHRAPPCLLLLASTHHYFPQAGLILFFLVYSGCSPSHREGAMGKSRLLRYELCPARERLPPCVQAVHQKKWKVPFASAVTASLPAALWRNQSLYINGPKYCAVTMSFYRGEILCWRGRGWYKSLSYFVWLCLSYTPAYSPLTVTRGCVGVRDV